MLFMYKHFSTQIKHTKTIHTADCIALLTLIESELLKLNSMFSAWTGHILSCSTYSKTEQKAE